MSPDNDLHTGLEKLANVRWRNTPFKGLQWYYAENRLYVLKYDNGRTKHYILVKAKSPSEAARKSGWGAETPEIQEDEGQKAMQKKVGIELARKFFDEVYKEIKNGDDTIYEFIDPECKHENLSANLNFDTVKEVVALGFRQKYGTDWHKESEEKNGSKF